MLLRKNVTVLPKYAEVGRLYKGSPKVNGRSGKDLFDEFRIEINPTLATMAAEREEFDNLKLDLEDRVRSLYGGTKDYLTAKELTIRFPFEKKDNFFQWDNRKDATTKSGTYVCSRRCNGVTVTHHMIELPGGGQAVSKEPIPCAAGPNDTTCPMGCKPKGRIQFFIEGLGYSSGVFVFPMGSGIDVGNMEGFLLAAAESYYGAFNEPIDYRNLLFRLNRREGTFNAPTPDGGTIPKKNGEVHLQLDTKMSMQMHQKTLAAGQARFAALLSGTSEIDREENYIDLGYVEDDVPEAEYSILATYIQMLDAADTEGMIDEAKEWIKPKIADAAKEQESSLDDMKQSLSTLTAKSRERVKGKATSPALSAAK